MGLAEILGLVNVGGLAGLFALIWHFHSVKGRLNPATKGHFGSGHSGGLGSPPVCPQPAP